MTPHVEAHSENDRGGRDKLRHDGGEKADKPDRNPAFPKLAGEVDARGPTRVLPARLGIFFPIQLGLMH